MSAPCTSSSADRTAAWRATCTTSSSRPGRSARCHDLSAPPLQSAGVVAAIVDIPPNVGYPVVFVLIAIETMGIPVPGETALITAALLAHDGQMDIVPLVVVASLAAIVGDNIGFAIGRRGGRRVFAAPGPLYEHRLKLLEHGEPF